MRAVILAAGRGSRLNGHVSAAPKALLDIGGLSLIQRQIRALRQLGIHDIVVVVGCEAERVKQHCGPGLTFVENADFATTNSLYSLWLARPLLQDGFVVLNCDVLFHTQLLGDLLTARHDAALMLAYREPDAPPLGDEEMKVRVRGGRVVAMSKAMNPADADGENVGMVRFDPSAVPTILRHMDAIIDGGSRRDWAPRAFEAFAKERPLYAIGTRGFPWSEIDFPEDYERAMRDVLPLLEPIPRAAAARGLAHATGR
jgi:choline kinase